MSDFHENTIRERAQWLWHQAGSPEGQDLDFWLQAEREVAAEGGEMGSANGIEMSSEEHRDRPDNFSPTPFGSTYNQ
ncbi:MAG: hypothetical protein JWR51_1693 [Devosia sp.]|uniref:DUF2934 domain-containing protein n=1 Tax=Devosia sp. TaxID=1871048 RepID=UPI002607E94C|nr:DUF2934 domain-containing protein [Devosia sp.]MDB5528590.1 hypothetical protein [Devosia sp.]